MTPWTAVRQAPLSMGFPRQKYWSGLSFLSPKNLPNPGIEPGSPALQADSLPSEPPGKPTKSYSVQSSRSVVSDSVTPWAAACQASLSITNSQSLLKLMSIELVMPSNHLILCWPLLFLPLVFLSIRVFSVLHIRWPNYWSFSFSISPLNEYSGLISFTIDWFDLAVQGTLESLLQHHSSKASVLRHSAFFMVQLSHPYMTTGPLPRPTK